MQNKATILKYGICNFLYISDWKALNSFSALQSHASRWINFNNYDRTSKLSWSTYRTRNVIHFSLDVSDISSLKIENFVFWILLTTHSVSTGHRTFDIIFLDFVRSILIFFNTLKSWPICWNKLRISFAVW